MKRSRTPKRLSKVHWMKRELVCEISYLTWAKDRFLRHAVFVGLREDKPAKDARSVALRSYACVCWHAF